MRTSLPAPRWSILCLVGASWVGPATADCVEDLHFGHPKWSPRGDLIALDCGPGGARDLCVYEVESGRIRRLTEVPEGEISVPAFAPDGRKLSFSWRRGETWYLSIVELGRREIVELLALEGDWASSSSWLPDGTRLAFDMANGEAEHDIFTIAPDGSDRQLLIGGPGPQRFAAFSPDGSQVAYTSRAEGRSVILVANADGSHPRTLVAGPGNAGVPLWSPDGRWLSFYSDRSGNYEIYVTDLSGEVRRLTDDPAFDVFATFAPEGTVVVFESTRSRDPGSFDRGADLFRLDLATLAVERLTTPADFPPAVD